jgi:LysR family transcriptional regulator, transcription activator of glutamate synthase operon
MELQQLKYFQTVARLGHMTRAAEVLYVSQPSLSRSIARLEQELGAPLFDRQGRRIRLNQYGQVLLRRVEFAFEDLERARREIADLVGPEQGMVTLAVLRSSGAHLLPPLLSAFRRTHPHIRFQLFQEAQDASFSILRQLEEGEIDLCLCPPPHEEPIQVEWQPVMTDELVLAVPQAHQLAERDRIQLAEAASESFLCLHAGTSFRALTDSICQHAGFKPDIVMEVEEFTMAWEVVAAGGGIAIVPEQLWQNATASAPMLLRLEEQLPQWVIGIAWNEGRYLSRSARLFRDFTLHYFAEAHNERERSHETTLQRESADVRR